MSPTHTVHVSGIASTTTEASLHDFFTFCGTINSIDFRDPDKTAVIQFEKPSAAKTALMLNGGALDGATLSVTTDALPSDEEDEHKEGTPLQQSDKPRAGIAAEYLAKGYTLSDQILQRAIEIDNKQGISKRFLEYFQSFDSKLGERTLGPDKTISGKVHETVTAAAQQAKTVDAQKGYSKIAGEYYEKALASPLGVKVKEFYTTTSKQVHDIHEEARRIAVQHKASPAPVGSPEPSPAPASASA
ncbi:uncharacterized protein BT62DRAFT_982294 [Guyanagaster necrorhizus]|uniref:RRM domain-containing protein n=1 Tax=Guyanagaster necrorhizus TaxID=856835 RepID=A0A9P7VMS1_9AGAR|nr:uncharacterized protein BT62DRAFT_982294 [Guyanagaster necrorhizus MCA 3950]KAG7443175.1 hypothetical protein BT62DRAFT_982294 [Guyanagaster necrorhizus MCA 3950]